MVRTMDEKEIEGKLEEASLLLRSDQPNLQAFLKLMREVENMLDGIMYDAGITSQNINAKIRPEVVQILLGLWSSSIQLRTSGQYSGYFDATLSLWDKLKRFRLPQEK